MGEIQRMVIGKKLLQRRKIQQPADIHLPARRHPSV
jgi:hypothetical protein